MRVAAVLLLTLLGCWAAVVQVPLRRMISIRERLTMQVYCILLII